MTSHVLIALFFATGAYPLWVACEANRRTTLRQATGWAAFAWTVWACSLCADAFGPATDADKVRYLALSITGCAGVAVLGARRPGVGAWNFVLFGLLAVMLLPLAESLLAGGELHLVGPRLLFLAATLAVILVNYLPTQLGLAATMLAAACALAFATLSGAEILTDQRSTFLLLSHCLLAAVPWAGYQLIKGRLPARSEFDRLWLDFRDRFGLVWGQRLREQFNRSAAHAGWPVVLRWQGLRLTAGALRPEPAVQTEMVAVLRALLMRFGTVSEPLLSSRAESK